MAPDPRAALMRFLMSVPGTILLNTPALRLPEELRIRPDHRLLDLGCGRASLLRLIESRVRFRVRPIGLDTSGRLLARAARSVREADEPPAHLVRALPTRLPFADDTFDIIICGHLFKHLSDEALLRCLAEVHRTLRPGGVCIAWEFAPTGSRALNQLNRWVLSRQSASLRLRSFGHLSRLLRASGFEWVEDAGLRPFLLPPIPRVSLIFGKPPEGWPETMARVGVRVVPGDRQEPG